ncbi:hypothetical protein EUGRSUZ_L00720 [Eucalyptus grandis]|uniref:Uncharacterized protein n=1 Tax=Eucalyptus grandis TaxID=71139 RepID=A0A058ZW18_EUCGR|nr:hypothetical protein EUGRSUZ_L00720 [Eucalyptus grandis]
MPATQHRRLALPPKFDAITASLLPSLAHINYQTPSASVPAPAQSPICRTETPISPLDSSATYDPANPKPASRTSTAATPLIA